MRPCWTMPRLPLCRGREPALLHGGPAAGCFRFPAALSGGHRGAGSILAESLAACGIPVRVSCFSSLRGYTVLRVLKGFQDKNLQNINQYFASGWNRDGLALRAAGDLVDFAPGPAPRHLLILLTDASPNDSRRVPPSSENPLGHDYGGAFGVDDAAARCVICAARGCGSPPSSWGRTAPAATPNASTAKTSPASAAWTNWPAPPAGSSRTRSGSWAIEPFPEPDCAKTQPRFYFHNHTACIVGNVEKIFSISSNL